MAGLYVKKEPALYPLNQKWFPLTKTETIIGRGPPADVVLPAIYVSRTEARVVREGEAYYLEYATSHIATFFKGRGDACLPGKATTESRGRDHGR